MTSNSLIKSCLIVAYSLLIAFVPEMPNLYTVGVNFLGFILTLTASVFLIWFLITRPPAQRNLLNRILTLFVSAILLATIRSFFMSIVAYFFESELAALFGAHPMLSAGILSLRCHAVMFFPLMSALSAGRLLLFMNPVVFHLIYPPSGVMIIGFLAVMIGLSDFAYNLVYCSDEVSAEKSIIILVFKAELGIRSTTQGNLTAENELNVTTQAENDRKPCSHLPLIHLMILCSIVLEVFKVVYVIFKEYFKMKKAAKVEPQAVAIHQQTSTERADQIQEEQTSIPRSESLPRLGPSISLGISQRKNSMPILALEQLVIKPSRPCLIPKTISPTNLNLNNQTGVDNSKTIIKNLCVRTASFITVFGLAVLIILVVSSLAITSSTSSVAAQIIIARLFLYVLIVLLVSFDKDILEFIKQKCPFIPC